MKFIKQKGIMAPFIVVISIFLLYGIVILVNIWPIDSTTIGQAGVFGDSFGVLTSLFSGLAFAGLIVTIWQQKMDLDLTRSEIKVQHFENVLFKMIEIHNSIVSDLDLRKKVNKEDKMDGNSNMLVASGRDCFSMFYKRLKETYDKNIQQMSESESYVSSIYVAFFKEHQQDLGHYFRYLYNIFRFINESGIERKQLYTNIVRAQLSDYEILLLFYNCISPNGVNKFKPLVEEFHLLDNLPVDKLLDEDHVKLFEGSAYE
ncbi:MAG: putative phage abortive infection protein [Gammaproteobacteria bacterium]|nr:putative phage abortive infection protein [Gammaproteobacteria bacterium]